MALLIILFLTMATAAFCLGSAIMAPNSAIGARLRSIGGLRLQRPTKTRLEDRIQEKVLDRLSGVVPKSPDEVSRVRRQLMMAGYREGRHLTAYYGIRVLLALVLLAVAVALGISSGNSLLPISLAILVLAWVLPRFVLKRKIRNRQQTIRFSLPDALDLSVICVEAGLSLDQSINRVGAELRSTHPELSDELNLVNLEMRAGKPRGEALRNLATRTGVEDVRSLVAVLVQTDRFGTSVAQALRVHSDALRTERRQRAEEAAAKTTIKMVPALVFFVFPAMFIVSLGPAFIQLLRNLLPELTR